MVRITMFFLTVLIIPLFAGGVDPVSIAGPAAKPKPEVSLDEIYAEISELRADINLLNLYNGMNLTIDQIEVILREAKAVACEVDLSKVSREKNSSKIMKEEAALLREVSKRLKSGKDVSSTLQARYQALNRKKRGSGKGRMNKTALATVEKSAAAVEAALSNSQLEVLRDFNPCLIPPKNLRDPVRVGQVGDHTRSISLIERVRKLPVPAFESNVEKILDGIVKAAERHTGKMSDEGRAVYREKAREILLRVREMDEAEFLFNKQDLAVEIEPFDRKEAIKEQLREMGFAAFESRGQVTRFFLTPRAIPLLEKRLRLMKKFKRDGLVDLDNVEGADGCRDGGCAID